MRKSGHIALGIVQNNAAYLNRPEPHRILDIIGHSEGFVDYFLPPDRISNLLRFDDLEESVNPELRCREPCIVEQADDFTRPLRRGCGFLLYILTVDD